MHDAKYGKLHLNGFLADKYETFDNTSCKNTDRPQYGGRFGNFEKSMQFLLTHAGKKILGGDVTSCYIHFTRGGIGGMLKKTSSLSAYPYLYITHCLTRYRDSRIFKNNRYFTNIDFVSYPMIFSFNLRR